MSKWLVTFDFNYERIGLFSDPEAYSNQELADKTNRSISQLLIRRSADIKITDSSYAYYLQEKLHHFLKGRYEFVWLRLHTTVYIIVDQSEDFMMQWKLSDTSISVVGEISDVPRYRRLILNNYRLHDIKPNHIRTNGDAEKELGLTKLIRSGEYQLDVELDPPYKNIFKGTGSGISLITNSSEIHRITTLQAKDRQFLHDVPFAIYFKTSSVKDRILILSMLVTDSRFIEIKSWFKDSVEIV